ncbi:TPA: ead/Ea22-like family protein [Escherichia coli]
MSKIDYQKLREIAEKTKIAGEAPVMPFDQRINALNDFMKHFSPDIALALLDERERNQQYIKSRDQENEDIALTVGKLRVELEAAEKRIAELEAEPVSNSDELPLDYLQGHKDGLEWAAQLAEANHPQTGDWLYDDPLELAKAIRKGPDMPEFDGPTPVTLDGWISCSERMPENIPGSCKEYLVFDGLNNKVHHDYWVVPDGDSAPVASFWNHYGAHVTHWMPLPEPPKEVNRG